VHFQVIDMSLKVMWPFMLWVISSFLRAESKGTAARQSFPIMQGAMLKEWCSTALLTAPVCGAEQKWHQVPSLGVAWMA